MATDAGQLIVELQGNVIRTVALTMPVLTIGRGPENGLVLPHPEVSRRHAELRIEPTGPVLTDLGSSRGTTVGGVPLLVHQPKMLIDGVVCEIGPFVLTYRGQPAPIQTVTKDGGEAEPMPTAANTPLAKGPGSRYLRDLPIIFHGQDFFGRFLQIFESIWEPLEQRQDHIDMYFDPRTCPASFIPWLASWLHIAVNPHWPETRRRALVAEATELYRWRGTRYGLTRLLKVCTGLTADVRDDPAQPYVFHVTVTIPSGSDIRRELLEELIETHKPAHAGYVLEVRS